MGLRTVGQSEPRIHFGLGDARRIDRVEVRWPGGRTTELARLPVNRFGRVFHPDAER